MPRLFALLLLVSALAACRTPPLDFDGGVPGTADLAGGGGGGGGGGGSRDLAVAPDLHSTPTSCCGVPGNPGNELGVGKFCQNSTDCAGEKANICAATFASGLNFCTQVCTMGGGNGQCGSGAQCQCGMGQCACIPGECVMPPPGC
jgi:hypothetical protein